MSDARDRLDAEWAGHRPAVFGAAYRITGSVADADDIVQDVWLRAAQRETLDDVRDLRAFLVTVAARRAYDVLTSARARRVDYVGPWLPEPLLTGPDAAGPVLVDDLVGTAMLVLMEELTPAERVAFVLRRAFEVPYERIAEVLGRTPDAARQLVSRARRKVGPAREAGGTRAERERIVAAFRRAQEDGDAEALLELLAPDATYTTDGGGELFAARKVIAGAERVAAVLVRVRGMYGLRLADAEVNGEPGLVVMGDRGLNSVDSLEIVAGRVTAYRRVLNPSKLASVAAKAEGPARDCAGPLG
ncbi:sigma-70 family RNA polymerase sigma factor [Spirillospora sp. CA-294931]|uniref:sigma-70 family RNA polymerase sigma factor n=1 Tax=Spirillospora sp. CA-294931 TaxID=3240042 RepID=UPI003D8C82DA